MIRVQRHADPSRRWRTKRALKTGGDASCPNVPIRNHSRPRPTLRVLALRKSVAELKRLATGFCNVRLAATQRTEIRTMEFRACPAYTLLMANSTDFEILRAALIGYQHERARIDDAIAELKRRLATSSAKASTSPAASKRRALSPAARRRIALAQKKRWAAYRSKNGAKTEPKIQKRKLSAEGRRHIVEALKKRWAAVKAAKAGK